MGLGTIAATLGSVLVGGTVAAVTVVGLVTSQTSVKGDSPANVNQPVVEYGATEIE